MKIRNPFLTLFAVAFLHVSCLHGDETYVGDTTIAPGETVVGKVKITNGVLTVLGKVRGDIVHRGTGGVVIDGAAGEGIVRGRIKQVCAGGFVELKNAIVKGSIEARGAEGENGVVVESSVVRGNIVEKSQGGVLIVESTVQGSIVDRDSGDVVVQDGSLVYGGIRETGEGSVNIVESEVCHSGRLIERGPGNVDITDSRVAGRVSEGDAGNLSLSTSEILGDVVENDAGIADIVLSRIEGRLRASNRLNISPSSIIEGNVIMEGGVAYSYGVIEGSILFMGTSDLFVRSAYSRPASDSGVVLGDIWQVDAGGSVFLLNATIEGSIDGNGNSGSYAVSVGSSRVLGDIIERGQGGVSIVNSTVEGNVDDLYDGSIAIFNKSTVLGDVTEVGSGYVDLLYASQVKGDILESGSGSVRTSGDSIFGNLGVSIVEGSIIENDEGDIDLMSTTTVRGDLIESGAGQVFVDPTSEVQGQIVQD